MLSLAIPAVERLICTVLTVRVHFFFWSPHLAMMVAVPDFKAKILPFLLTLATSLSLEDHLTSPSNPVAFSLYEFPAYKVSSFLEIFGPFSSAAPVKANKAETSRLIRISSIHRCLFFFIVTSMIIKKNT